MFSRLLSALRSRAPAAACVLMYHRIAEAENDVWDLAVSPATFEQQMKLLKQSAEVLSVSELVEAVERKSLKRSAVAITFDDGYADNFLVAKPILDHYQLPATFFIPSQTIGTAEEFWSDELAHLLLATERLPPTFAGTVAGSPLRFELGAEAGLRDELRRRHQRWKAVVESPPTLRGALFLELWQRLRPLPYPQQQQLLQHLRAWAGVAASTRPAYRVMSREQLQRLGSSHLHAIGVHTVSHPALALHSAAFQQQELLANKIFLENAIGKKVTLAAYPYGNYSQETMALAAEAGLRACFTTEEKAVTTGSDLFRLGRFQVKDRPAAIFSRQLKAWQHSH